MPFIDLNKVKSIDQYDNADFLVIGAGAAGILLAVELSKKGKSVVLIESGHFDIDDKKQQLNNVINSAKILDTATYGRYRAIGGTTLQWGGGASPFSKLDFAKREWVLNSGWPIKYEEIEPYYEGVDKFMKINKELNALNINNPGFDPHIFEFSLCKWASQPNFQKLYKNYLKKNVIVIYNALVQKLEYKNSKIEAVSILNFNNISFSLKAKNIILAAGCIECVRILLSNPSLANESNNYFNTLGKMFMEHPSIRIGSVISKKSWHLQNTFNTHFFKQAKYSLRLNLSDEFQKENHVLSSTAGITMVNPDENDPFSALKNLKTNFTIKRLIKTFKFIPSLARSLYSLLIHNFVYKPEAQAKLFLMTEQEPLADSYITLSTDMDAFGIPKAEIHWSISPLSWKTIVLSSLMVKKEIERLQLGEVYLDQNIYYDNPLWLNTVSDVNHHMGGSRMSTTPETGVVDPNLKVWGIKNLYVCSSAVFPTGSHSNPTATMLALGLRLVDFFCGKTNSETHSPL